MQTNNKPDEKINITRKEFSTNKDKIPVLLKHLALSVGLYDLVKRNIINITLRPSKINKKQFESIKTIQTKLNMIYYKLSKDIDSYSFDEPMYNFLHSIYVEKKKSKKEDIIALYIRSDYLLDFEQYKQVEINTISQCFVSFGPLVNHIHSLVYPGVVVSDADKKFISFVLQIKSIYESKNYIQDTIIAMVDNSKNEVATNYMEKVQLIHGFLQQKAIVRFVTLDDLKIENQEEGLNQSVYYENERVSIVYYRWYYNLDHYNDESKRIRRDLELANVISLPSVEIQMINSKLFQVVLADKLHLYTKDDDLICKFFGNFISNKKDFEELQSQPGFKSEEWLEKSVDEGGNSINKSKKGSIYMKKFKSPTVKNSFLNECVERDMINEVSIFGCLISVNGDIVLNEESGYIVRSKDKNSLEGGICSGNGGLDSIQFIN